MIAEKTQPRTAGGADEFLIAGGVRAYDEPEKGRFTTFWAICPVVDAVQDEGEVADEYPILSQALLRRESDLFHCPSPSSPST